MVKKKMLPIGYDSFEAIRGDDFYYVDKTGLIKELLASKHRSPCSPARGALVSP